MVAGKQIPYRVAFWLDLILLLLLLTCAPFLPAYRDRGSLDYTKTWFCLTAAHTFLDHLRTVAGIYCALTALALVHLYQKARGKAGTYSLLAYAVPNTVVLLVVFAAIACVFAAERAGQAVAKVGDLANMTLYYRSGEEIIYGGGASPLLFAALAIVANAPFWFVLVTRSWKPKLKEVAG